MAKKKPHKHGPGKPHGMNLAEARKWEQETFDGLVRAEAYKLLLRHSDHLIQQCMDAAFMAVDDMFQLGPENCEEFGALVMEYMHDISDLINTDYEDDKELVYSQEKIDRRMRQICGEHFVPWEVRYGRKD